MHIITVKTHIPMIFLSLLIVRAACKKQDTFQSTLQALHTTYKNGMIETGMLHGEKIFRCSLNAYDAGSVVYNEKGIKILDCNAAWGASPKACHEITDSKVIYRVKNNIWGLPAINICNL